jgi:inorganic pyrophosphatase-like protein
MKTTIFKGLHIRIENPAGSVRSGVDSVTGKPWSTKLTHDYGEIIGTNGVDDDPVDVFLGPNKSAPFVYVVHQLQKQTGEWDEDKCFLGFNDAMAAKAAYYKNYDHPELFYGDIETIPFKVFKEKLRTHTGDTMIHGAWDGISVTEGDPVTVDGMRGRGVVTEDNGSDVIVRFRNGMHVKRKKYNVHNLGDNAYHSKYMSAYGTPEGVAKEWDTRGRHQEQTPTQQMTRILNPHQHPVIDRIDPRIIQESSNQEHKTLSLKEALERADWVRDTEEMGGRRGILDAEEEQVERENAPVTIPHGSNKRVEKQGALFCVVSDGVDKNFGCYGNRAQAKAVMNGKSFIEPDIPANMYAAQDKCPACGSRQFALMPTDFETAKCRQCGKTWNYGVKAASGLPQTGWTYGRRTMPVGRIQQRTLSGFPSGKGGGAGALPKAPMHGIPTPKSTARPHPKPTMHIAKPAAHHSTAPKTLPKPPAVTAIKKIAAPHVMQAPKTPTIKAPKAHKLESFGDLGEPMAGALGHAHIEPETWFHPPSERHPQRIPTDDVGEKDDRFLDVTKRKQAHEDRMKRLKRSAPGGLPPYIPAVTTLGASLLSSADKKKKLIDIIPRNTTLSVPHTVAYIPGVKAGRTNDKRMRQAFNAAHI